MNIGLVVSERLSAMRKLQDNPNDSQAITEMYKSQQQVIFLAPSLTILSTTSQLSLHATAYTLRTPHVIFLNRFLHIEAPQNSRKQCIEIPIGNVF